MSQKSTLSANSDGMRSGSSSRRGSAYTGDSIPAVTVSTNDSGKIIKESGSRGSIGKQKVKRISKKFQLRVVKLYLN